MLTSCYCSIANFKPSKSCVVKEEEKLQYSNFLSKNMGTKALHPCDKIFHALVTRKGSCMLASTIYMCILHIVIGMICALMSWDPMLFLAVPTPTPLLLCLLLYTPSALSGPATLGSEFFETWMAAAAAVGKSPKFVPSFILQDSLPCLPHEGYYYYGVSELVPV